MAGGLPASDGMAGRSPRENAFMLHREALP